MEITQELAQKWLEYNQGKLYWKYARGRAKVGSRFGSFEGRYRKGKFFGKWTTEHQLVYLYHHGKWVDLIDHKDRNTQNNAINNLRESNKFLNAQNVDTTNHKSKQIGVGFHKSSGKWRARSWINGKRITIGYFITEQEAINAYREFNLHRL